MCHLVVFSNNTHVVKYVNNFIHNAAGSLWEHVVIKHISLKRQVQLQFSYSFEISFLPTSCIWMCGSLMDWYWKSETTKNVEMKLEYFKSSEYNYTLLESTGMAYLKQMEDTRMNVEVNLKSFLSRVVLNMWCHSYWLDPKLKEDQMWTELRFRVYRHWSQLYL